MTVKPGKVASINVSSIKGEKKTPTTEGMLVAGHGMLGDAHSGSDRQVSLLMQESVVRVTPTNMTINPGDFGENLTTEDIPLTSYKPGQRLIIGGKAILEISEIGKECSAPCSIGQRLGECIMPREGIFARVLHGGKVSINDTIAPTNVKVGAVITSSDRCASGERKDESGAVLIDMLRKLGIAVSDHTILPDEIESLSSRMVFLADRCALDIILTTGGTGLSPRDRMPEATFNIIDSPVPGIAEAIRYEGQRHTPYACISRGISGIRGKTLIINLPGSKRAVSQSTALLHSIIPHALESLRAEVTDCGKMQI